MPNELTLIVVVAGVAALASLAGGALALLHRSSTLVMSTVFGFAGGALIATLTLAMLPQALELASPPLVVVGFVIGYLCVYGFDLFVHGGQLVGEHADQARRVHRRYRRHPPLGGAALVIAAATSAEELIEGLTIGVGGVIEPGLATIIALAIGLDNLSEGMAIGELIRAEDHGAGGAEGAGRAEGAGVGRSTWRRTMLWTGTVGAALFGSAVVGYALLRGLDPAVLGVLIAVGAGAMLYLTLGDLLPEGQARQYQQSTALAAGAAFVLVLVLGQVLG